jgi:hypothetical protein
MLYTAPQRDNYTRLSRVARRERPLGRRGTFFFFFFFFFESISVFSLRL